MYTQLLLEKHSSGIHSYPWWVSRPGLRDLLSLPGSIRSMSLSGASWSSLEINLRLLCFSIERKSEREDVISSSFSSWLASNFYHFQSYTPYRLLRDSWNANRPVGQVGMNEMRFPFFIVGTRKEHGSQKRFHL